MAARKKDILKKLRSGDVNRFTLKGIKTYGKILSVYDGDTCDVAFYRDGKLLRFACRLKGYNAPELKGETLLMAKQARDHLAMVCTGEDPDSDDENYAVWSKKELQEYLDRKNNLVYAIFGEFGKYGRPEVTLKTSPRGKSINDMMRDYVDNLMEESSESSDMEY